jgi:hypothetical protein
MLPNIEALAKPQTWEVQIFSLSQALTQNSVGPSSAQPRRARLGPAQGFRPKPVIHYSDNKSIITSGKFSEAPPGLVLQKGSITILVHRIIWGAAKLKMHQDQPLSDFRFLLQSNNNKCTISYANHMKIMWPLFFFHLAMFSFFIRYRLAIVMYFMSLDK